MANFTNDPDAAATDAVAKQYVGVRMQQAVPLLDSDWNLLDDLRRLDLEAFGRLYIGSGVPSGYEASFRIGEAIGVDNDFTIDTGIGLVDGKGVRNDHDDLTYAKQAGYKTDKELPELKAPIAGTRTFLVVLDVWEREVNSEEDITLLDPLIGIETTVRLKRDWRVRAIDETPLVRGEEDREGAPLEPHKGHHYLPLARITRLQGVGHVAGAQIEDLRETGISVLRRINDEQPYGTVDTQRFQLTLDNTRRNVFAFINYITTRGDAAGNPVVPVEILGFEVAAHIAHTAAAGLAQLHARVMSNEGALRFLRQLYDAERAFFDVWRSQITPLAGKYAFLDKSLVRLNALLDQPMSGNYVGLLPALNHRQLVHADRTQQAIATWFATVAGDVTRGSILVAYAGGPSDVMLVGSLVRLKFKVLSLATRADYYTVTIGPPGGWAYRKLIDPTGIPLTNNRLLIEKIGKDGTPTESSFFVDVIVEDGQTDLAVTLQAETNPDEVQGSSSLLTLKVNEVPPAAQVMVFVAPNIASDLVLNTDAHTATLKATKKGSLSFRIHNESTEGLKFKVSARIIPGSEVGGGNWTVLCREPTSTATIQSHTDKEHGGFEVTAPAGSGSAKVEYSATSALADNTPVVAVYVLHITITP